MNSLTNVAIGSRQMQILLVAGDYEDFAYLRDLLVRAGEEQIALNHAHSFEEALALLKQATYDLVLCDYNSGDGAALRLLHELRERGLGAQVIFLSDFVDEATVEAAIRTGAGRCCRKPGSDVASVSRDIRHAIEVYCKERQRQKAEDALRKLWGAVEQSADLVIITDRDGVIEYVNPAFEVLTGYSREETIGQTPRMLKSEEQTPEIYKELWQTILSGAVFRGILANRKKNGEIFLAEKTITPLRDAEGKITHFISNDRDITERRRLETQLQQAQKMDAIGKLAGGVAHDFNNLLMVISAYAELMLDSVAPEHPLRRNVQEIMTASRRAADLTRQLLAFGRKQVQSLQLVDLNWIVEEINKMLPRLIGEDIELIFAPGQNLGKVKADLVQIEQIVMNLAANARDAMPKGGKLTIETANVQLDEDYVQEHSIVPAGDYVLLAVTDSGTGIASEHMAHIFEPFYTTKGEGKGTGLGLATVWNREAERWLCLGIQRARARNHFQDLLASSSTRDRKDPLFKADRDLFQGMRNCAAGRRRVGCPAVDSGVPDAEWVHRPGGQEWRRCALHRAGLHSANSHDDHRRGHAQHGWGKAGGSFGDGTAQHEGAVRLWLRGKYGAATWGD